MAPAGVVWVLNPCRSCDIITLLTLVIERILGSPLGPSTYLDGTWIKENPDKVLFCLT